MIDDLEVKWLVVLTLHWLATCWISWKVGRDGGYKKGEADYWMDGEERDALIAAESKLKAIRQLLKEDKPEK